MNRNKQEFNIVLDSCLERLLKGESLDKCLADNPQLASELKPLLQAALAARRLAVCAPRPEFRTQARYQFNLALQQAARKKKQPAFSWHSRWATAAIAFVALITTTSGTVVAASNSMPDQVLYPVKLVTEQVRVNLTPTAMGKALLMARLVNQRVAEIVYAANKQDPQSVELVTRELEKGLEKVALLAENETRKEKDGKGATADANSEQTLSVELTPATVPNLTTAPASVAAPAPALAPPAIALAPLTAATSTPAVTQRSQPQSGNAKAAAPEITEKTVKDTSSGGTRSITQSEGVKTLDTDKEKLKKALERYAINHQAALQEKLKSAPESMKPALRKAITASVQGYLRALEAINDKP